MKRIALILGVGFLIGWWTARAADAKSGQVQSVSSALARSSPSGKATVRVLAGPDHGGAEHALMAVLELAANAEVPTHRDATEEFVYVLEGGGLITIDGKRHTLSKGDAVYMPAGAEVRYINGPTMSQVLQVFAPPGPEQKYEGWAAITGP